jgi:NADH dehydrogenase (ubiquinone) 1 alpha subcomplex subunit 9
LANSYRNFDLEDVHVWGASRIAEAVAKYDVDRFVHVSSHSVSEDSPSEFYRTKARGEQAVRNIFPETTIVRPAPLFGWEDRLLNLLASAGNLFTSNALEERFWPVHAIDVGMALEQMMHDDNTASQTFELYGPKNYSMAEIAEIVDREIVKKRRHFNVPKAIRQPLAKYMNKYIWWPVGSADEVEREFINQTIDTTAKTFADLNIEPAHLENLAFQYLVSSSLTTHDLC